jgi:hypothetical protein
MKYLVLFLLALAIPVTAAYAIESPFTSKAVQATNRVKMPKNPFTTKNPFANSNAQKTMDRLRGHQPRTVVKDFDYNGDDNPTYAKSREKLKSSPINRSRGGQDIGVFYRD